MSINYLSGLSMEVTQKLKTGHTLASLRETYMYRDGNLYRVLNRYKNPQIPKKVGYLHNMGYIELVWAGTKFMAHRLIFWMHHGWMPSEIDRINGIKTDNRIENLRPCSKAQNQANVGLRSNNTSGQTGVTYIKSSDKWQAALQVHKVKYSKKFNTFEEAQEWRNQKAKELQGEYYYDLHTDGGLPERIEDAVDSREIPIVTCYGSSLNGHALSAGFAAGDYE